jgi:hypothetical protein
MVGTPFPAEDSPLSALDQGRAIYRLLNQTQTWVDGIGRAHLIDDMSVRYKANVVAYLQRRAANLAEMYAYGQVAAIEAGMPMGEAASDMLELAVEAEEREREDNPNAWLSRTPLVMRLLVDVAQGNGGRTD